MRYNRRTVTTITAPTGLAVSLPDMKAYLVISGTADDGLLTSLTEAAQDAIKRYLRRGILTETIEMQMDGFPGYDDDAVVRLGPGVHTGYAAGLLSTGQEVDLPYSPVQSFTSVTTFDRANASGVLSAALYSVDLQGGRIYLNEGQAWPQNLRDRDAVRLRYVIGSAAADIPASIILAIKQHVSVMYECRSACELPDGCKAMLASYRRIDDMGFA